MTIRKEGPMKLCDGCGRFMPIDEGCNFLPHKHVLEDEWCDLGSHTQMENIHSLIKLIAEEQGITIVESDQVDHIDVVFDGADQIDSQKFLIKGGGGALLRENILFSLAKKIIIMADKTKFVKNFTRTVPVEVHPLGRNSVTNTIQKLGGKITLRSLDRGYPFFTENGNIILDCDFGTIKNPKALSQKIKQIPGVMESGIFVRKPDVIYKAKTGGKFEVI
jgi:ribose 5-phosphate isomerase A